MDGVAVDHADDGHAQVASNAKGDAEADAGEDGDDVASGQTEARAVHHGHLLLLQQLRPALGRQLDGLAIFLLLLKSSTKRMQTGTCTSLRRYRPGGVLTCSCLQPTQVFQAIYAGSTGQRDVQHRGATDEFDCITALY